MVFAVSIDRSRDYNFNMIEICFFKSCKGRRPSLFDFLFVLFMETLFVFDLVLLIYVVLPNLDVVKGAMLTNCLCSIPANEIGKV
jgi:chitin synthase